MAAITFIGSLDIQHGTSGNGDSCKGQGVRSLIIDPQNEIERVPNVFLGSASSVVSIQGDYNTKHIYGEPSPDTSACNQHSGYIEMGSSCVFINGKGIGRIGDLLKDCTSVQTGASSVFAGG